MAGGTLGHEPGGPELENSRCHRVDRPVKLPADFQVGDPVRIFFDDLKDTQLPAPELVLKIPIGLSGCVRGAHLDTAWFPWVFSNRLSMALSGSGPDFPF